MADGLLLCTCVYHSLHILHVSSSQPHNSRRKQTQQRSTGLEPLQLMRAGAVWGLEAGCVSFSPHPWQPQGVLLARVGAAKTVPVCSFPWGIRRQISTNDVQGLWDGSIRVLCSGSPGLDAVGWGRSEVCFRNLQAPAAPACGSRPLCGRST